ncbi:nicotinamide-nucleotide amidase [Chitinophaga skermanii]|uniref:CinA-like protein n=1 Tax=Chitinophaga skermanii TaxID=331697 RepID=A0A327QN20_9BACT|nr:CinA family nicotinamide mononucleotide deamidase-related protein [Chitinophaga skermanii]RAJ05094.1 nicotinamide-nucleotide amidase [Chitinophaga skermanii]
MEKVTATIITIGDELLIGQTIDTNSAWMAQHLNAVGIWVQRRVAVGDSVEAIVQALNEESQTTNIILITGGLGPTADDITKPTLCKYFGGRLVEHQPTKERITALFASRGLPTLDRNMAQAMVPDVCTVIDNMRGTAPGMWFDKDGKVFVSMPGVPFEMKGMMEDSVIPKLVERFNPPGLLHQTLLTAGMGESFVAERLVDFEAGLPGTIKLAYLPSFGLLKLRLTANGKNREEAKRDLDLQFEQLKALLEDITVAEEDIPMSEVIAKLMLARGTTVGTAESCTGGGIAAAITSLSGSSTYFKGGIVSYANEIKQNVLGVKEETLAQFGAVSEETVREMVAGALKVLNTDYIMAVSGIMGPNGGSEDKPVGTVWIASGDKNRIVAVKHHMRYDRKRNIALTINAAMNQLKKFIEGKI